MLKIPLFSKLYKPKKWFPNNLNYPTYMLGSDGSICSTPKKLPLSEEKLPPKLPPLLPLKKSKKDDDCDDLFGSDDEDDAEAEAAAEKRRLDIVAKH